MSSSQAVTTSLAGTPPPRVRISMEEYLDTIYHPDCDLVDGFLEKRNVGESEHSYLQGALSAWFFNHRTEWKIRVATEFRNRVSETRVRIPDVCVVPHDAPRESIRTTPPILCIKIRSREDRLARILRVFEDYRTMGVANIWLLDPIDRTAMVYNQGGLKLFEGAQLIIEGSPIYLDFAELFATLD